MIRFPFARTLKSYVLGRQNRISLKTSGWSFSGVRANMIVDEMSSWQAFYLPINLKGKVVLDVGAGEGETAKFFLEHGASKVICVEPEVECYKKLLINSRKFKGIIPINEPFQLKHLQFNYDFLKMDIEGYEESLLSTKLFKPAVIEVHGLQLRDRFKKSGYKIEYCSLQSRVGFGCICFAYWMC